MKTDATILYTDWFGCYDSSWRDLIVDDAFAHPAKMAHGLLTRIIEHGLAVGWWSKGDLIGDPFGGNGSTGIVGQANGLRVVCVELEPRFVDWARRNFKLWERDPGPAPVIIQGDSRRFAEIVAGFDGIVTSPSFQDNNVNIGAVGDTPAMRQQIHDSKPRPESYGATPGQIGNTKGDTYWAAMAQVYGQCRIALKPGGILVCVLKDYVKNKKRVPLCDQTVTLLESLGFTLVERIRAWLVSEDRHPGLFGEDVVTKTDRKSFFRRLAEAKGLPEINWEEVIVVRNELR